MKSNRIFKAEESLARPNNKNPFLGYGSRNTAASNLKSNANFSIMDKLTLKDLLDQEKKEGSFSQVVRLAYIADNNQIHLDEEALFILQKFTSSEMAFISIYGSRGSGKSLLYDKILNLAGVEGSHFHRTSQNYEKGLYFYSTPFKRPHSDLNIFLLDCVGFDFEGRLSDTIKREEQKLLDLMMILSSSVVVLPSPQDTNATVFQEVYNRLRQSTLRITENKLPASVDSLYWPQNVYCLFRKKQKISKNFQDLEKIFINYNFSIIYDAMADELRERGVSNQDLGEIQAMPENNNDGLYINGIYIKQASRLARQLIEKAYNKKYWDLKYNGNIVCKLLLSLIKNLNKKSTIRIDKIFHNLLKQLYQSAYAYHVEFYDQKLQEYLMEDAAYPIDYLLIAFQNSRQSIVQSFRELTINKQMHEQYEQMIEKYIEEKQYLILEINKKKTKFQIKNHIKSEVQFPRNVFEKEHITKFKKDLQSVQPQLDHDRCNPISATLKEVARNLQNGQDEESLNKQREIIQKLSRRISQKKSLLESDKKASMTNIILNDQHQKANQNHLNQIESLSYKLNNVKKQIDMQKKFQKQYITNKQASKQHAQRLLTYIRQLQEKSRDNEKVIAEINKEFEYNPTIDVLNKRIEEKIRRQKQIDRGIVANGGQSEISRKTVVKSSQVRIINNSNASSIRRPSRLKI